MKDWNGNKQSIFTTLGASNHVEHERAEYDYYATEPLAMELLLQEERFSPIIWEPACGEGHLSKVLEKHGYEVINTDLVYRGFGAEQSVDFLKLNRATDYFEGDIITNPPYKYAKEFVEKALELIDDGQKVAMFLKLTFLEGKARKKLFAIAPPKRIYVSSSRLQCAKNGDFEKYKKGVGLAIAYCWYVWEKGYKGDPTIRWIN